MAGEVSHHKERRSDDSLAREALLRLEAHEELCGERYKNIDDKMDEVKNILSKVTWALLAGMTSILAKLLFF